MREHPAAIVHASESEILEVGEGEAGRFDDRRESKPRIVILSSSRAIVVSSSCGSAIVEVSERDAGAAVRRCCRHLVGANAGAREADDANG